MKFIKNCFILLMAAVAALPLAACGNGKITTELSGGGAYYTFVDHAGTKIVLNEAPKRTAVLFSSFAEVWKLAGGETAVTVGESVERGFADETVLLVDGGAGKTIDTERLLSYKPDFVICSADIAAQAEAAKLLNQSGIPAAVFHVETFSDYLNMLKICTDITGNFENYKTYGTDVEEKVNEVKKRAEETKPVPQDSILFVRAGSTASATKAKTAKDNFVCVMLNELGTRNIAENAAVLLDGLSIEEILAENPAHIFVSAMGNEAAAKAYMESVLAGGPWQGLSAVQTGQVHFLPKDLFQFKPNARWGEAYEYLYDLLYTGLS